MAIPEVIDTPLVPTLQLAIDREDGTCDSQDLYPWDVVKDNNLEDFFNFYENVTGMPSAVGQALVFLPTFGSCTKSVIKRGDTERSWKMLRNIVFARFVDAQKADRTEMDFWVLVHPPA